MSIRYWSDGLPDLRDLLDREIWDANYPHRLRSRITGDGYEVTDPHGVTWTVASAWTLADPRDGWRASAHPDPGYGFADEDDISVLVRKVLEGPR